VPQCGDFEFSWPKVDFLRGFFVGKIKVEFEISGANGKSHVKNRKYSSLDLEIDSS
jgi:hypothetical protein